MSVIGALAPYLYDYTACIDKCSFWNTSKQTRLGFDNTACLLGCNSAYTTLRNLNLQSVPIEMRGNQPVVVSRIYKPYISTDAELQHYNTKADIESCTKQCQLNAPFMSVENLNKCQDKCTRVRVWRKQFTPHYLEPKSFVGARNNWDILFNQTRQ